MQFFNVSQALLLASVLSLASTSDAIPTPDTSLTDGLTTGLGGLLNGVKDSFGQTVKYGGHAAARLPGNLLDSTGKNGKITKRDTSNPSLPDGITNSLAGFLNGVKDSLKGTIQYVSHAIGRTPNQILAPLGLVEKITKREIEALPDFDFGQLTNGKLLRRSDVAPITGPKHLRPFLQERTDDKSHPYNPETGKGGTIVGEFS